MRNRKEGHFSDHPHRSPLLLFSAVMVNFHCLIKGCNADVRKKSKLKKYPWMVGVTFHSFPHKKYAKLQRSRWIQLIRREKDFRPTKNDRICSQHFLDGKPSKENPNPCLFPWNNYGKSRKERACSAIKKKTEALIQVQCCASVSDSESDSEAHLALPLDLEESDRLSTLDPIPGAAAFEGKNH